MLIPQSTGLIKTRAPLDLTYQGVFPGASIGGGIVTYNNVDIGTASSDRYVILCGHYYRNATGGFRITSASVNSIANTEVLGFDILAGTMASISYANVPTGTSVTVQVGYSTNLLGYTYVSVYTVTAPSGLTVVDSDSSLIFDTSTTASVSASAGDFLIANMNTGSNPSSATISGDVSQDYSFEDFVPVYAGGSGEVSSSGTKTVTYTANASTNIVANLVSFRVN